MATLAQTTQITRKLLAIIAGIILAIIMLVVLFNIGTSIKESLYPTPAAPPSVSFGKIPALTFPQQNQPKYSYTLNTISGNLPTFSDRATVYKLLQPQPSLVALDNIKALLEKNNFKDNPSQISDSIFQWKNENQTINYNIVSNDFLLQSNYLSDANVKSSTNLPNQPGAIDVAKQFFTTLNAKQDDIDFDKTKTSLFTIQNGTIIPASSLSNTQVVRVDFFQQDVNKLPVFYPDYPHSIMYALVAGGISQPQVVEAAFTHNIVVADNNATYPIKTAKQAFDDLKSGNAYISNYDSTKTNVTIQNVVLGYYIGGTNQQYLYPIIVFEGDNNFYAFVSAITDEWMSK
jgi:hypothetical protein